MVDSKKVLVAFDPDNSNAQSSDFLVPVQLEGGNMALLGCRSGKLWKYGMVVLTSRAVNKNDIFARLVEAGHKVQSVDACLSRLELFVEKLRGTKIGNIIKISANNYDIRLEVVASTPSAFAKLQS